MRILLADDHLLFRDSLKVLVETHDHDVVGLASNGREAVAMARELQPDLVLMDLHMPDGGGLEATQELHSELPEIKVIILTASEDDEDLFEAIKAGADGLLPKDIKSEIFFSLIEGTLRGEPALTPKLAKKLLDELRRPRKGTAAKRGPDALTGREEETLKAMMLGVTTNRELARHFGISANTVKFHVRNILDKLHVHNRAELVSLALRKKLVDCD